MRKTSGFTLIELMVVLAIIAILATAGLSAYTGYLRKARDAKRIEDLRAIESIIMGSLTISGKAPDLAGLKSAIREHNNQKLIEDPLVLSPVCIDEISGGTTSYSNCLYSYAPCDDGGYILRARFESASNVQKYTDDPLDAHGDESIGSTSHYDLGSCGAIVGGESIAQII